MKTDFKFWYIRRDDNGFIEEATVRFYEGDLVMKNGKVVYERTKRLGKDDLKHLDSIFKKESNGNDAKVYTQNDFGLIKTDEELVSFLKSEIKKDKDREVINEQK